MIEGRATASRPPVGIPIRKEVPRSDSSLCVYACVLRLLSKCSRILAALDSCSDWQSSLQIRTYAKMSEKSLYWESFAIGKNGDTLWHHLTTTQTRINRICVISWKTIDRWALHRLSSASRLGRVRRLGACRGIQFGSRPRIFGNRRPTSEEDSYEKQDLVQRRFE